MKKRGLIKDRPQPVGAVDGRVVPRYAGFPTFARLPSRAQLATCDVALLGIPFDAGASYRPGARFGPQAVREASRLLRSFHAELGVEPFARQQVADAGDVDCNPFNIEEAISQIEAAADDALASAGQVVAIGGDHSISLPLLRSVKKRHGIPVLVHFDAHLDTWNTYFGEPITHGTTFRRAAEEHLFDAGSSIHVGIRGPLYSASDVVDDAALGFEIVRAAELQSIGVAGVAEKLRTRIGDRPTYLSIDIDVLDPAYAPGTGTPEPGGLSSRELLLLLRSLSGLQVVGADVVEVAPSYDHAQVTALGAAHVIYELLSLMAVAAGYGLTNDLSTEVD